MNGRNFLFPESLEVSGHALITFPKYFRARRWWSRNKHTLQLANMADQHREVHTFCMICMSESAIATATLTYSLLICIQTKINVISKAYPVTCCHPSLIQGLPGCREFFALLQTVQSYDWILKTWPVQPWVSCCYHTDVTRSPCNQVFKTDILDFWFPVSLWSVINRMVGPHKPLTGIS